MSSVSLPTSFPSRMDGEPKSCVSARRTRSLSDIRAVTSTFLPGVTKGLQDSTTATYDHQTRFSTPEPGSENHVAVDMPDRPATPPRGPKLDMEPKDILYAKPLSEKKKKELERHMLGLFEQYSTVKSSGSRSYNYQDKYPEDQPGEELRSNARFFNVYLDEAEKYDDDMIRGLSGTLDALLIFAALFSAVVTTFVVDTRHALEPDQALITSALLFEQLQYFRANGNATIIATIQPSQYTPESPTHSMSDVWVNGLFFTSLSLSLVTALLSVLAKQWLQAYTSVTSGSAQVTALIRHLRFMGFEQWKVPQIIGFLPLILHASLGVFIAGLLVFLRAMYPILSWIVIGTAGPAFFAYLVSIILPAIYIRCPYRITVLYTPMRSVILLLQLLFRRIASWHRSRAYDHWWKRFYPRLLHFVRNVTTAFSSVIQPTFKRLNPTFIAPTLKGSELRELQDLGSFWSVDRWVSHASPATVPCSVELGKTNITNIFQILFKSTE